MACSTEGNSTKQKPLQSPVPCRVASARRPTTRHEDGKKRVEEEEGKRKEVVLRRLEGHASRMSWRRQAQCGWVCTHGDPQKPTLSTTRRMCCGWNGANESYTCQQLYVAVDQNNRCHKKRRAANGPIRNGVLLAHPTHHRLRCVRPQSFISAVCLTRATTGFRFGLH